MGQVAGRLTGLLQHPRFTYNPALLKNAPKDAQKVDRAPGPNNPVGTICLTAASRAG